MKEMSKNDLQAFSEAQTDLEFKKAYEAELLRLELVDLLLSLREETGLNQKAFAERVGKPRSTICRIEKGTMEPSLGLLEEIAFALGKRITVGTVELYETTQAE